MADMADMAGTATRMNTATATVTPTAIPMTTDAALLRTLWLASPALPVGGFSYSEGLEAAVDAGQVRDEASAAVWLNDQLLLGPARSDLAVAAQAIAAWRANDLHRVRELNAWVLQTRETSELRLQAEQMGRSLLAWAHSLGEFGTPVLRQLTDARLDPPTWPVASACAAAQGDASTRDALIGLAFGWAENMVQAAIKAVPLGQGTGQRLLAQLTQAIPTAVNEALALDDAHRQAFTPMLAILSARHETQYSRLFRS
jgi:urease accessory protein